MSQVASPPPIPVLSGRTAARIAAGGEAQLWEAYRNGRSEADASALVAHYLPLLREVVAQMVTRYPRHVQAEDFISFGLFGLFDAVKKFDPTRSSKFEAYAQALIRFAILDGLRRVDWVPRDERARSQAAAAARDRLRGELGREPSAVEAAAVGSVAEAPGCVADWAALAGLADGAAGPADVFDLTEIRLVLAAAVARLDERDRLLLWLYYSQNRTLTQIGDLVGMAKSMVSRVQTRAVRQLRAELGLP